MNGSGKVISFTVISLAKRTSIQTYENEYRNLMVR